MTKVLVDIDNEALAAAARELGTSTKVETINRALREIATRPERIALLDHLRNSTDDLGDGQVMARAWQDLGAVDKRPYSRPPTAPGDLPGGVVSEDKVLSRSGRR